MVRYFCDLCKKETDSDIYCIPIQNHHSFIKMTHMHLCYNCSKEFSNLAYKLTTMDMEENLDKLVNNEEDY